MIILVRLNNITVNYSNFYVMISITVVIILGAFISNEFLGRYAPLMISKDNSTA